MIVIRRMVDRRRAYTAIFLKGEPPKIFPTSDAEHARILQVYKQDRPHEGILNDFAETDSPRPSSADTSSAPPPPHAAPAPWPLAASPAKSSKKTPRATAPSSKASTVPAPTLVSKKTSAAKKSPRPPKSPAPLWLALTAPPSTPARL